MSKKRLFAKLGMIALNLVPGGGVVGEAIRQSGKLVFGALLDEGSEEQDLYVKWCSYAEGLEATEDKLMSNSERFENLAQLIRIDMEKHLGEPPKERDVYHAAATVVKDIHGDFA